jgi:hypothetical protein
MKKQKSYGDSLILTCGSHPQNDIHVRQAQDFDQRPNGGCKLPCDFRLNCGHVCSLFCHTFDKEHLLYECPKICDKEMKCGHRCKQICSQCDFFGCSKCDVLVDKVVPECGHSIKIRCDQKPSIKMCENQCLKFNEECKHVCKKMCKSNCLPCEELIEVESSCQKHGISKIELPCGENKPWNFQSKCKEPCQTNLECSHLCNFECGQCFKGLVHQKCSEKCDRILFCGHKCKLPCAEQCMPCEEICRNKCAHSLCKKKCQEPCRPCNEPCKYKCEHFKCTRKCNEFCNRPPCNEPCKRKLKKCGHPCIGICGEPCPKKCRICDEIEVKQLLFGDEDEPNARFILLEDCKHFIEVKAMDNWIESKFGDNREEIEGGESKTIQLPECPKCKTPIRLNLRYSNYIKKQLASIEEIKSKQYGNHEQNRVSLEKLKREIFGSDRAYSKFIDQKLNFVHQRLLRELKFGSFSYNQIIAFQNIWSIFRKICDLHASVFNYFNDSPRPLEHLEFELAKIAAFLGDCDRSCIEAVNQAQRLNDLIKEIDRVECIFKYYKLKCSYQGKEEKEKCERNLAELEHLLINQTIRFEEDHREHVLSVIKELQELIGTKISDEERLMIVKAMGLNKGIKYK